MRKEAEGKAEADAAAEAAKLEAMDAEERTAYEAKKAADAEHASRKDRVLKGQLSAYARKAGRGRGKGRGRGRGRGRV